MNLMILDGGVLTLAVADIDEYDLGTRVDAANVLVSIEEAIDKVLAERGPDSVAPAGEHE